MPNDSLGVPVYQKEKKNGETIFMNASLIGVTHQLQDAVVGLRIVFSICLVAVILAGLYVIKKRRELFGRDPHVTADTWASRNLRLWQVFSSGSWRWIF